MSPDYIVSQGSLFGAAEVRGFGTDGLRVELIDPDLANSLIRQNHYSRRVATSTVHLGVIADGKVLGVLQYGWPMNPHSGANVVAGTEPGQFIELNRMWLHDDLPRNTASTVLSYSLKFLRRHDRNVRWVQSFADERCQGRLGVVYQAANFIYCGEHTATFWELDGEWFHNSLMTRDPDVGRSKSKRAGHLQRNRGRAIGHDLRQFRYLYFLAPSDRKRLVLPVRPYPKPAVEVSDGDTPGDQPGEAGSIPAHRSQPPDNGPAMATPEPEDNGSTPGVIR